MKGEKERGGGGDGTGRGSRPTREKGEGAREVAREGGQTRGETSQYFHYWV